ncbi:hypothetical protein T484DRAFT_1963874 [Baffinella frigidus]|nr:hypothetical protein T484DRAFT_1963874 [Cryptophyta sp. CCMP2293]|mmetsp:Transcript_44358/g.105706  ORF Transcript_44358/g.105706 Transcript_44358/m.105706 type:complete len:201 (-) Transcript_44358:214-816(-)
MTGASAWLLSAVALALVATTCSFSVGPMGSTLRLRRGVQLGNSVCTSTRRSVRPAGCRASSASSSSSDGQESDDSGPRTPPPNFNPEKMVFAPGKSRYEQFYTAQGQGGDAVDASSTEVPSPDGGGDGEGHGSNPFFIGYEDGLLQSLLDVHTTNYGERSESDADEPQAPSGSGMGGLQDLIMGICEEVDLEKEKDGKSK